MIFVTKYICMYVCMVIRVVQQVGGAGMSQSCPRFVRERHENSVSWDLFDQPSGEMSWIRGLPTM